MVVEASLQEGVAEEEEEEGALAQEEVRVANSCEH